MRYPTIAILALVLSWAVACDTGRAGKEEGGTDDMLSITSPAFGDGEKIPVKYTADGEDVSPPLVVRNVPEKAKELALICEDPDAPRPEPWIHWVMYGIDPATKEFPEGFSGAQQGQNSWPEGKNEGWGGPSPPKGTGSHRYVFTLYALDAELDLGPGATKEKLKKAMEGHVVKTARLTGTYTRD